MFTFLPKKTVRTFDQWLAEFMVVMTSLVTGVSPGRQELAVMQGLKLGLVLR